MSLLNNPVSMEIVRENGRLQMLDVILIYEEAGRSMLPQMLCAFAKVILVTKQMILKVMNSVTVT